MDLQALQDELAGCPCGRPHVTDLRVEIGQGLLAETGALLRRYDFPQKVLLVADDNTLAAGDGVVEAVERAGFHVSLNIYPDMRTADMERVEEIMALSRACGGILSVGSGSLNDICRLAATRADKKLALFATAPSMDGFASDSAPITTSGFKFSHPCRQPDLILADTDILAAAPAELKAAGFGDMIAKYIALADWRIAALTGDEFYCEAVAGLTRRALARITALADRVPSPDAATAQSIMEALVLSGVTMRFAGSVRPASGAEHVVSHFWEIKKLEQGELSDFHGKKVGVATLLIARLYHDLTAHGAVAATGDRTDWEDVYRTYGPRFREDIDRMNTPTVTAAIPPQRLRDSWDGIRAAVREEIPDLDTLRRLMAAAGAAADIRDIAVPRELGIAGLHYHAYMRYRLTLARLVPMLGLDVDYARYF